MTTPDDDLQAGEGVNEGSAAATDESSDREAAGNTGALAAASETGRPKSEYDPAPPVDAGLPLTATDKDEQVGPGQELQAGPGQELQAGEG